MEKAQFYGTITRNSNFGDIIKLSKGKVLKINEDTIAFQQTNDYQVESTTEDIIALYLVEKIRHHDLRHGYRYDLRFTIIPIGKATKNLEGLRKRIFILRDIDYPEYFSAPQIPNQISMRSDIFPVSSHNLNYGEYQRKLMRRPVFHHNQKHQNRLPVRFPDSQEALPSYMHPVRQKNPHIFYKSYQLDHRGAVPDLKKIHEESSIAVPMYLAVPQMSLIHTIPMFPVPLPMSYNNNNQRSLSTFSGKNNIIPPRKSFQNENHGENSNRVQKVILLDDRKLNESVAITKHESKAPIKYSPKLSENMDQNNDFRPIVPPFQYMRRVRNRVTTTASPTTLKIILEELPTSTITSVEKTTKTQKKLKSYDILATRPSLTHTSLTSNTTERVEKPMLKWYPKKQRNRATASLIPTTTLQPTNVETTPMIRNNSSTRSLFSRGRNRFMLSNVKKNRNETTTTEKSLSSKWKAITITSTNLPTTESMETTKLLPNYAMRENESTTLKPQNNYTSNLVELTLANVEEVKSNSTNIDIYKATEIDVNPTVESTTLTNE